MKFHLVLRGALPPHKRGTVDVKHRIRREVHPQLKTLWEQHPLLWQLGGSPGRVDELAAEYQRCGFRFVPLIRKDGDLVCSLDVLILRRDEEHRVFNAGDLDGRLKTLLDGLRMPRQCTEVDGQQPSGDEDPFFCLMEDDDLIVDFRVTGDRLLVPPEQNEPERNVVALVKVEITTLSGTEMNVLSGGI